MQQSNFAGGKGWIFALTSIGSLMVVLDAMVVATALGTIRADLGASLEALEWTMNAYNLSFAVLLLTGAALGDRFGRRRIFLIGLGVFVLASAACALSASIGWLIAARVVQGAGAAMVTPLALALLGAAFPPQERGKILGLFGSVNGLALILGPSLGGMIAEGAAWQWIFWLNVPVGIILIAFARRYIPESRGAAGAIDSIGALLVMGASLAAVWALMDGNSLGWTSSQLLASYAIAIAVTFGFIAWQRRATSPMVPLRLFASPAFTAANGAGFLLSAALFGVLFFLPQFFQVVLGYGPMAGGVRLLAWTATLFIVAPISGGMVNRFGERPLIVVGLALQAIGMMWIALIAGPGMAYAELIAPLVLTGGGVSMAMPAAQNAIMNAVSGPEIGKAAGIYNMFRFLGAVSGVAVSGAVFAHTGGMNSPAAFASGFTAALETTALLSLLGAIVGLAIPGRHTHAVAEKLVANGQV